MANCEYVREHYGVPACIGRRVVVCGKMAIIAADRGHYIGITYDSDKPGVIRNAHPTHDVEYLDMGTVRPMTRAQRRYLHWLKVADCFPNWKFGDWVKSSYAREADHA